MFQTITYEESSAAGVLTISRAKKRGAVNAEMRREIAECLKIAGRNDRNAPRVLVIRGHGAVFSIGHDFVDEPVRDAVEVEDVLLGQYAPMMLGIEGCRIPTIAAVNGPAIGVGAAIALACDIVVMQSQAFLQVPFLDIGLIPDAGTMHFLQRRVGRQRAIGAVLLGEKIDAERALDWGLAWEVVDRHGLDEEVMNLANRVIALDRTAVSGFKAWLHDSGQMSFQEILAMEAKLQAVCVAGRGEVTPALAAPSQYA